MIYEVNCQVFPVSVLLSAMVVTWGLPAKRDLI